MKKITEISELANLSQENFIQFTDALSSCNYEIIDPGVLPDDAVKQTFGGTSNRMEHYKIIFDDQEASLGYFLLKFTGADGSDVLLPITVFGKSDVHKVYFPLVIDQMLVENFLKLSKKGLTEFLDTFPEEAIDELFVKFLSIKKNLIEAIFKKYLEVSKDFISAMAWELKGKESFTRKLAEAHSFNCWQNQELNIEFLFSRHITDEEKKKMERFIVRARWVMSLSLDKNIKADAPAVLSDEFKGLLKLFYQRLLLHEANV
ncbi:MAG: hypothetical protein JWO44_2630 [Bacteroidetes bacterium]|nr:hypothetical protein [Bacteroidota bacterium]